MKEVRFKFRCSQPFHLSMVWITKIENLNSLPLLAVYSELGLLRKGGKTKGKTMLSVQLQSVASWTEKSKRSICWWKTSIWEYIENSVSCRALLITMYCLRRRPCQRNLSERLYYLTWLKMTSIFVNVTPTPMTRNVHQQAEAISFK